jgi:hypothetical protein
MWVKASVSVVPGEEVEVCSEVAMQVVATAATTCEDLHKIHEIVEILGILGTEILAMLLHKSSQGDKA